MIQPTQEVTLQIDGAKLSVDINQLFAAWMEKQVGAKPAATPFSAPILADGETYVGGIIGKDGSAYHLILLPGESDCAGWASQMSWAKEQGGDLPDRVEQALLFKTMPDCFQKSAYWSNTVHADDSGFAWSQYFSYGNQYGLTHGSALRARAVRRLPI